MSEPPQNRDVNALHPIMRAPFLAWLATAKDRVRHVNFIITETLRTKERQAWLYAQGREDPYRDAPEVTWTMDSRHRWGLAVDIAMQRRETGELIWTPSSWRWLYDVVPPEKYGLRELSPMEWVHLEYRYAGTAIEEAGTLGLQQH